MITGRAQIDYLLNGRIILLKHVAIIFCHLHDVVRNRSDDHHSEKH